MNSSPVDSNPNAADSSDPLPPESAAAAEQDAFAALRRERDDLFERLARATAEFKNSQRRLEADRDAAVGFANERLLKALLPVVDNFDRALAQDQSTADSSALIQGMTMVHDELLKVLKRHDLELIVPSVGEEFDSARHEALVQQESNLPAGRITLVITKGYSLKGRILRPAQVALSKGL